VEISIIEIARILADPACRRLTLLGPGGIGKTRLVLEAAAGQLNVFPDGVVFVAPSSIGTPSQMVLALGDALHLSLVGWEPPGRDPMAYLLDSICETVASCGCSMISAICWTGLVWSTTCCQRQRSSPFS
jgi:hypothetical protein